jgi:hypothetical protein
MKKIKLQAKKGLILYLAVIGGLLLVCIVLHFIVGTSSMPPRNPTAEMGVLLKEFKSLDLPKPLEQTYIDDHECPHRDFIINANHCQRTITAVYRNSEVVQLKDKLQSLGWSESSVSNQEFRKHVDGFDLVLDLQDAGEFKHYENATEVSLRGPHDY